MWGPSGSCQSADADPRPGEYDVWRAVRPRSSHDISKSKTALVGCRRRWPWSQSPARPSATPPWGRTVTLNVDGHVEHVTAEGNTVGEVLDGQGISLRSHDEVAPSMNATVTTAPHRRPLRQAAEAGRRRPHLDVLGHRDRRARRPRRDRPAASTGPTCRSAVARASPATVCGSPWPRPSADLRDRRPARPCTAPSPAMTVGQALTGDGRPASASTTSCAQALHRQLSDGDKVVLDRIRIVRRQVSRRVAALSDGHPRRREHDPGAEHDRARRTATACATSPTRSRFRNGHLVAPEGAGTAGAARAGRRRSSGWAPRPSRRTTPAAPASGTTSRSASPAATGRPTPATATTAGSSSSLGTWHAYGGSGLPSNACG